MADEANNPLRSDVPGAWDQVIEAAGPASILAVIELRMSPALRHRHTAEDIFQEALLHAWRDRGQHEWRGARSFRNWLLSIIDHRIRDLADKAGAQKRGGGVQLVEFSRLRGSAGGSQWPLPWDSTTPSRVAVYREQADAIRAALVSLPDDVRDVVRLRLLEQLSVEEIAERLNLGASAVRHRFRKGAELYQRRLVAELATRSIGVSQNGVRGLAADSAPDVGDA